MLRFLLAALATPSFALPVFLPNPASKLDSGIDLMLVADPFIVYQAGWRIGTSR